MAFDVFETIEAFTRKAYDQEFNDMLDEDNTLFMNLAMGRAKTVKGNQLAIRSIIDEFVGKSTQSGFDTYDFQVKNLFGYGQLNWTRFTNGMGIDGYDYEIQTGNDLEKSLRGDGMGMLSSGGVRTLIALHKEQVMATTVASYRQISAQMYGNGTGHKGKDILGLKAIMDPSATYAGIKPTGFGYHQWTSALPLTGSGSLDSPHQNGMPAKWSPIFVDMGGGALSCYGVLQKLLITLNKGGSTFSRMMPRAGKREYEIYVSQNTYAGIEAALRNVLRRPDTGSGASAEIGGFQDRLMWDSYRATFYPDTDCEDDELYAFNVNCVDYCQINSDTKYMGRWRLSDNQDVVGIPYKKTHQMRCQDRSQCGRISNFNGVNV